MGKRAAYGAMAERFAECIPPDASVVVFDESGIGPALRDAAHRRSNGELFYARAILRSPETVRLDAVLPAIFQSFPDVDDCRTALENASVGALQVNGATLRDLTAYSPAAIRSMSAILRLADGLVVSGESERRRIEALLGTHCSVASSCLRDPKTPVRTDLEVHTARDTVVVWAPGGGDEALSVAVALQLHHRVAVISSTAPTRNDVATWVSPDGATEILRRATLIVDTTAHGSECAVQLASWGAPLVVDVESGAQEHLDGVLCFDRRDLSSIHAAAVVALGAPPPRERNATSSALELRDPAFLEDGPLVSIVLPTFSRATMLKDALDSVVRQSYRNIETIVINDAGDPIDDLIAAYPKVRLINMATNDTCAACNAGFRATSGKYVAILNDDDIFFPNHIASLVTALERSGGAAANADVLTAFLDETNGSWVARGFESNMSRPVNVNALLVSNQIGAISGMFRRDCIDDETMFEKSVPFYRDYELWLRLATRNDFIHVERLTSCYTIRNRGANQQSVMWNDRAVNAYREIYARYPVSGRPVLQRRREQLLPSVGQGQMGVSAQEPAVEVEPFAWPPWGLDLLQQR